MGVWARTGQWGLSADPAWLYYWGWRKRRASWKSSVGSPSPSQKQQAAWAGPVEQCARERPFVRETMAEKGSQRGC